MNNIKKFRVTDIMGNKVIQPTFPPSNIEEEGTIYSQKIKFKDYSFHLNNHPTAKANPSKIVINIEFKKDYTFILVADDTGIIFSSSLENRIIGWRNNVKFLQLGVQFSGGLINDTNIHCFIVRCQKGYTDYWDLNGKKEKITEMTVSED